jgi:hypothetical protein
MRLSIEIVGSSGATMAEIDASVHASDVTAARISVRLRGTGERCCMEFSCRSERRPQEER